LENQGVYEIPCGSCDKSYIGQTNRRISVRVDEHRLAVEKKEKSSALALHVIASGHKIDFNRCRTVATEQGLANRLMREAIEIEKRPTCLNKKDDSLKLPSAWRPIIRRVNDTTRVLDNINNSGNEIGDVRCTDRPKIQRNSVVNKKISKTPRNQ
jgi:hypothetical protein